MFDLVLGWPDESSPVSSFPGLPSAPQLKIPADVRVSTMMMMISGNFHVLIFHTEYLMMCLTSLLRILLEDHLIHVGYTQFDKELLLLAFPADR